MKVPIPSTACRPEKWFFRPPEMNFGFLDMIFGGKELEIHTVITIHQNLFGHITDIWSKHFYQNDTERQK